jgi:glycosyltransferase involved in cell wall biosynthesis
MSTSFIHGDGVLVRRIAFHFNVENSSVRSSPTLKKIWGVIPRPIRHHASSLIDHLMARKVLQRRTPHPGPVTVVGLFLSSSGMGQAARLTLRALQGMGLDTRYVDLTSFFHSGDTLAVSLGEEAHPGEGGTLLIHLNPPELPRALNILGRGYVRDKRLIGYWNWELPKLPASWESGFGYLDEVWVPTRFVADAVKDKRNRTTPVYTIPLPVPCSVSSSLTRADFGLPDNVVLCLTMFDMRSGMVRKNPIAAIRAFRMAFGDDPRVVLAVKVSKSSVDQDSIRELKRETEGAKNICFVFQELQAGDVAALLQCADIVISLHRSEGFGLMLAEAMHLGKPVIATGWSGNLDFMNTSNSALVNYKLIPARDGQGVYTQDGQLWAEPDIAHASDWLRKLAASEQLRKELGEVAARGAKQFFEDSLLILRRASHNLFRDAAVG